MVDFFIDVSTEEEIYTYLVAVNGSFVPPLNERVDIKKYSNKLFHFSTRIEAYENDRLVGMVAMYCNNPLLYYITSVSVLDSYSKQGLGKALMEIAISHARTRWVPKIDLEVNKLNSLAIKLYQKTGFKVVEEKGDSIFMSKSVLHD